MGLIDWIKLISPVGWATITISLLVGFLFGYILYKLFPQDRKLKKILNDPHLLVEKLKANGNVYDHFEDGRKKELNFRVGTNAEGKEVVVMEALSRKTIKKEVKEKKVKTKSKKATKKGNKK